MTQAQTDAAFLTKWINERLATMADEVTPSSVYRHIKGVQAMRQEDICALLTLFLLTTGAALPRLPPAVEP